MSRLADDEAKMIAASMIAVGDVTNNMLLMFKCMTKQRAEEIMDCMNTITQEEMNQIYKHIPEAEGPLANI